MEWNNNVEGETSESIKIEMIIEKTGKIKTAYPLL